jgi:hypothetical protein
MKAISIITCIMALALQISSTFAQNVAAIPEFVTTAVGRPILINVVDNDNIAAGLASPEQKLDPFVIIGFTQPKIVQGMGNGVMDAGSTAKGLVDVSLLYTPAPDFLGTVTFTYDIRMQALFFSAPALQRITGMDVTGGFTSAGGGVRGRRLNGSATLTGTVTVMVVAEETIGPEVTRSEEARSVYKIENQVSTETALNLVNLSNLRTPSFNFDATAAIRFAAGGGV